MDYFNLSERAVVDLQGKDRLSFLQGLISNDIRKLSAESPALYTVMLSPQGKILYDFFLILKDENLWIDIAKDKADAFLATLKKYRLRAKVTWSMRNDLCVIAHFDHALTFPSIASFPDPRHSEMGWRSLIDASTNSLTQETNNTDYHMKRMHFLIPDSADFLPDKSYVADYNIDSLHGVSFNKGCYVGQEVVARMKHRSTTRKQLCLITPSTATERGSSLMAGEQKIGVMLTQHAQHALALCNIEKTHAALQNNIEIHIDQHPCKIQSPTRFNIAESGN